MNVLQIMGCTSNQYASMERYLVTKADAIGHLGGRLVVIYEDRPSSRSFIEDFAAAGGILLWDHFRSLRNLRCYARLLNMIKRYRIDLVHGYFTPTCHYLSFVLRTAGFSSIVRTAANMPYKTKQKSQLPSRPSTRACIRHRLLAQLVKKIICRSQGVLEAFLDMGISPQKLAVADGGCDTELYHCSEELRLERRSQMGLKDNQLVIGVACRLVPVKRVDRLIRLIDKATKSQGAIRVLVVGDGPERKRLQSLINKLGMTEQVELLGHRDDLPELYCAMDVFCLPSEMEGMSNSILEAMACELPILAGDIPSNQLLVQSNRGGFLLDFEDEDSGSFQRVLMTLKSGDIRKRMGRFNRALVVSEFSLTRRIEKELSIYQDVLEGV